MASNNFFFFVMLLLLVSPCIVTANENKISKVVVDVVVEGVVYCQSCDKYGSWSLSGGEPITSAKVSVVCKNHKDQVSFYKAYTTDVNGYFYAQLDGFKMNHYLDHPLQSCKVKLVASPLANCSQLSNVNYGIDGTPLRYGKRFFHSNYEAVVYSVAPLAFRPAHCPDITTTHA